MKRIGIIGLGQNATDHIKKIQSIDEFDLVGLYDHNPSISNNAAKAYGLKSFSHPIELIEQSEIIDFVSPHPMDCEHINLAIKSARHLFLENHFLQNTKQAQRLINLVEEAQVKVQISSSDRFNPAVQKAKQYIENPSFIETRRAIAYSYAKDNNISVMDLLLQDVDLVLNFVESGVRRIQTRTNNPFGDNVELINVRIEFDNACVANLNISSLSPTSYSKAAFYQQNAVINIDLLEQNLEVLSSASKKQQNKSLLIDSKSQNFDSLRAELQSFHNCIEQNTNPIVGLNEASYVLEIMEEIRLQIGA